MTNIIEPKTITLHGVTYEVTYKEVKEETPKRHFKEGDTIEMMEDCTGAIGQPKKGEVLTVRVSDFQQNLYVGAVGRGCTCQHLWKLITPAPEAKATPTTGRATTVEETRWFVDGVDVFTNKYYSPSLIAKYIENGMAYRDEASAECHFNRIKSMKPQFPMPKNGEGYYLTVFVFGTSGWCARAGYVWSDDAFDVNAYNLGRVFPYTEEGEKAARKWISDYSASWEVPNN